MVAGSVAQQRRSDAVRWAEKERRSPRCAEHSGYERLRSDKGDHRLRSDRFPHLHVPGDLTSGHHRAAQPLVAVVRAPHVGRSASQVDAVTLEARAKP